MELLRANNEILQSQLNKRKTSTRQIKEQLIQIRKELRLLNPSSSLLPEIDSISLSSDEDEVNVDISPSTRIAINSHSPPDPSRGENPSPAPAPAPAPASFLDEIRNGGASRLKSRPGTAPSYN